MTITNKKTKAVTFDKNRHFTAHDKVNFPPNEYSDGGSRPGMVRQEGSHYLLRLRSNPHLAEWVVFPRKDDDGK